MQIVSTSQSIMSTKFLLTVAWTSAADKVQGIGLGQVAVDFDLEKQLSFGPGQIYIALSRIKNVKKKKKSIALGNVKGRSSTKVNVDELNKYE